MTRRAGPWIEKFRSRIDATAVAERLQASVMGTLPQRKDVAQQIVQTLLLRAKGRPLSEIGQKEIESMVEMVVRESGRMDLSMSQVQAGRVLLAKMVPDLAQLEHKGEVAQVTVVRMPSSSVDSASWRQTVVDAEYRLPAPAGAADVPDPVPGL